jgi:hypothetical protein
MDSYHFHVFYSGTSHLDPLRGNKVYSGKPVLISSSSFLYIEEDLSLCENIHRERDIPAFIQAGWTLEHLLEN